MKCPGENILYPRNTLSDIKDYDAIWFGSRSLPENPNMIFSDLPKQRLEITSEID